MGMRTRLALNAALGLAIIGAMACGPDTDGAEGGSSGSVAPEDAGGKKDTAEEKESDTAKDSRTDRFKAFVNENGTPQEKEAVAHVTEVQGAEEQNDVLDSVDVHTDFTGGLLGEGTGPAKLIASAFADWKHSKNGLVTVYDADGDLLGNSRF
ncbi:hypothetical protein ACFYNZ_18230 [Streptomyces kebangsaanensis]|uniref:Lipoprotein n=1 Tax=Streptomyces kebangsaanensis TaxID=864058 RepID=A0ABW6KYG0_9ACTN